MNRQPTALIAEDEPLLAAALQAELKRAWPELQVLATVGDGESAVRQSLSLLPEVLFFDIQMPVISGLEAAFAVADEWPAARPFPALVFVTAFDQFAVQAFEAKAVDYLLKPVQNSRLVKTVAKLRNQLERDHKAPSDLQATLTQLRGLAESLAAAGGPSRAPASASEALPTSGTNPLTVIAASVGSTIHMVPVEDVFWFEAADKYIRVLTAKREYLIRTPLKELLSQLDPQRFWQVHRGSIVQASQVELVSRDEAGKLWLQLRGRPEKIAVSRLWAHQFKAM